VEDSAVPREAVDSFLHSGSAGIIDEYKRCASLQRTPHHLGDLVRVDLARCSARHRKVLARKMNGSAIHVSATRHHSVRRHFLTGHAEQHSTVLRKQSNFLERARIHQPVCSLPRGQFSCLMLLRDALVPTAIPNYDAATFQLMHPLLDRVRTLGFDFFLLFHWHGSPSYFAAGATLTACDWPLIVITYCIAPGSCAAFGSAAAGFGAAGAGAGAAFVGVLLRFFGPCSRVPKNFGATCGNIANVSTSSSLPLHPFSASASDRNCSHSGFSRSAGRQVIGSFFACSPARFSTSGSFSPNVLP